MTKHIDRLMSRASVAAMAAFAKEPVSTLPTFAERVEDSDAGGGDRAGVDPIDGLTAEEQAGLDAMAQGRAPDGVGDVDHSADDGGEGDGDGGEPEPAPAAADGEGDGAPEPAAADGRPKPKTISYGRHQKELARAQKEREALQAELDAARGETVKEREARLRLDERSRLLFEAINTKAPAAAAAAAPVDDDPEPNKDDDPIGHLEWRNRKLEKTVADLSTGQQRQQQTTAAENEERQVYEGLVGDIQRAAADDPTMTDAFVHLRETRYQELGFIFADIDINDPKQCATLSPADQKKLSDNIQQTFHNEQMLVARQSMAAGKSPAAVIRNLARARGWKPGQAAPAAGADAAAAAAAAAGAAAPAAPAAPAKPAGSVKDQLSAVRDNLEASRSLSDAGGSPGGEMTPERLASMSDAEFQQYYNSMPKDRLDRIMGKPANM